METNSYSVPISSFGGCSWIFYVIRIYAYFERITKAEFVTWVISTCRLVGNWLAPKLATFLMHIQMKLSLLNWPLFHSNVVKGQCLGFFFFFSFYWVIDIAQNHMQAGFLFLFTFTYEDKPMGILIFVIGIL